MIQLANIPVRFKLGKPNVPRSKKKRKLKLKVLTKLVIRKNSFPNKRWATEDFHEWGDASLAMGGRTKVSGLGDYLDGRLVYPKEEMVCSCFISMPLHSCPNHSSCTVSIKTMQPPYLSHSKSWAMELNMNSLKLLMLLTKVYPSIAIYSHTLPCTVDNVSLSFPICHSYGYHEPLFVYSCLGKTFVSLSLF